ncbi:hypothetical protein VTN77DRAFT_4551 [Rasamsonia byssochlamydoides]|uniref:uncharacterized protein n=1 Tax=Rasamsonia byssochlamydoides TaxID=89139 RepID=UPI003743C170
MADSRQQESQTQPVQQPENNKHKPLGATINDLPSDDSDNSIDEDFDLDHDAEMRNRRLWRLLCTPIVTVLVGPSERRFHLHRGLLRRHSLFFRSMLRTDRFQEGQTQVVRPPEDDVTSFAVFAEWLYVGSECDTGAIFKDAHGKNVAENDDDFLGEEKEEEDEEEEEEEVWETGSAVESSAEYDHYDFSLQFSCYVLADKLQAFGFKRHILDEIRHYGEFCDPSNLTVDQVRYVYNNTSRNDDPLRKVCLLLKCVQTPIHETLGDPEFQRLMERLMEEGGPLVRDVMEICRKHAVKEEWKDLYVMQLFP